MEPLMGYQRPNLLLDSRTQNWKRKWETKFDRNLRSTFIGLLNKILLLVKLCEKWFRKHLAWTTLVVQSVMGSPSFELCEVTCLSDLMTTHDRDAKRWPKNLKTELLKLLEKLKKIENRGLKWWSITPEGGIPLYLVKITWDGWKIVMPSSNGSSLQREDVLLLWLTCLRIARFCLVIYWIPVGDNFFAD